MNGGALDWKSLRTACRTSESSSPLMTELLIPALTTWVWKVATSPVQTV